MTVMWCESEDLRVHGCRGQGVKVTAKMASHVTGKRDEDRRMSGVESIQKEMSIRAYDLGAILMKVGYAYAPMISCWQPS